MESAAQAFEGTCTHSLMGAYPSLYYWRNLLDFCTQQNRGQEPEPGTSGHPAGHNNWACLQSKLGTSVSSSSTPDAYYRDSSLSGLGGFLTDTNIQVVEYEY